MGEAVVGRVLWTFLSEITVESPEMIRRPEEVWKHLLSCLLCPVSPKSPPPQPCGASHEDYPPTGPEETRGLHRSPRSSVLRVFLEKMLILISLTMWRSNWAIISKYLRKHQDENPPNPQKATYTIYSRKKKGNKQNPKANGAGQRTTSLGLDSWHLEFSFSTFPDSITVACTNQIFRHLIIFLADADQ